MSESLLEEHLEELCPNCGEIHEKDWAVEFCKHVNYKNLICKSCNYKVFKKNDFLTGKNLFP